MSNQNHELNRPGDMRIDPETFTCPISMTRRHTLSAIALGISGLIAFPATTAFASSDIGPAMMFGPRIPTDWFWFRATGQSTDGYGANPYETFSYDSALTNCGIEDYNVVPYTSVLPREAYGRILKPVVKGDYFVKPQTVQTTPGSVLEIIGSLIGYTVRPRKSATTCTGLCVVWVAEPSTPDVLVNGYAAEYEIAYETAVDPQTAETDARIALTKAYKHELSIRNKVLYKGSEPVIKVKATVHNNNHESKSLYVYDMTGIGVYAFKFPVIEE